MPLSTTSAAESSNNTPEFNVFIPSSATPCNGTGDVVLCPHCRELAARILVPRNTAGPSNDEVNHEKNPNTAAPFTHYATPRGLLESASQCELCSLIAREFELLRTAPFQYDITAIEDKPGVAFLVNWQSDDDYEDSGQLRFRLRQFIIPPGAADENNHHKLGKLLVVENGVVPVEDAYPSTPKALKFARTWLKTCTTDHSLCRETRATSMSVLPKRVLDISPHPNDTIVLYETKGEAAQYAALTYCWGRGVPLRTLTSNVAQHRQQGIPLAAFPQTMRDVIPFARNLGIRYLWIDALCIVQDDPLDWTDQAAAMTAIYRGCALNVAVADAPSCDSGVARCLQRSSVRLGTATAADDGDDDDDDDGSGESMAESLQDVFLVCEPAFDRHYNPERSLVSTRGWVFQETLVSVATLYVSHSGLFWHCCHIRFRQGASHKVLLPLGGGGINHHSTKETWARNVRRWASIGQREEQDVGVDPLWALYDWVQHLSTRRLSFARDKLPALAGLASQLAAVTGATYTAGLWDEDLLLGLTWRVVKRGTPGRDKGLGPSWSWVSLDARVRWLWCISIAAQYPAYITPEQEELDLDIEDIQVDEVFPGSFGEVRGGRITAMGTLYERRTESNDAKRSSVLEFDVPFAPEQLTCCFDEEEPDLGSSPPRKYYLLRIAEIFAFGASSRKYGGPYLAFLILEHAGGVQETEFRRVGYAHVDQRNGRAKGRNSVDVGERKRIILI
ncbi:heterokaryon incompatibility protein-domain-containing protein [Parachaetomium inaequale]|uniref:Heterokaryon incompatibility protein-domain-containing protein n=1 Tax=Parachaetomium inaequale TaxID=2588326 RepID=A0AAN6PRJ9_9PEZI|nr:heterokaryon incompatibility protein-domain-containing protein [Parachaetomium inaequale]